MKSRTAAVIFLSLVCSLVVFGQQGAPPLEPATDTVAPDIPGVVRGGTKVQAIKDGLQATEGPITLPDGSVIFTETTANRITKIDKDGNVSTFLENTNGSNALAFDTKGRLITVQRAGTEGSLRSESSIPKVRKRCLPTTATASH